MWNFIFFYCFTERKNNEQAYLDYIEFAKKLGIEGINKQIICNIYVLLREKLRVTMHEKWSNELLGEEIGVEVMLQLKLMRLK